MSECVCVCVCVCVCEQMYKVTLQRHTKSARKRDTGEEYVSEREKESARARGQTGEGAIKAIKAPDNAAQVVVGYQHCLDGIHPRHLAILARRRPLCPADGCVEKHVALRSFGEVRGARQREHVGIRACRMRAVCHYLSGHGGGGTLEQAGAVNARAQRVRVRR